MSKKPKPGETIFGSGAVMFAVAVVLALGVAMKRSSSDNRLIEVDWVDALTSAAIVAGPFLLGGIILMGLGAAVSVLRTPIE